MRISYDPAKRDATLAERGLDFEDAAEVFTDPLQQTIKDTRTDYGEDRYQTFGHIDGRLVMVAWTPRGGDEHRVISMRKANGREQARFAHRLGKG